MSKAINPELRPVICIIDYAFGTAFRVCYDSEEINWMDWYASPKDAATERKAGLIAEEVDFYAMTTEQRLVIHSRVDLAHAQRNKEKV